MHTIEQLDILIDDYLHIRMQLRYVKENHAKNGRHRELSNINQELDNDAISRKFLLVYNRKNNEDLYDQSYCHSDYMAGGIAVVYEVANIVYSHDESWLEVCQRF